MGRADPFVHNNSLLDSRAKSEKNSTARTVWCAFDPATRLIQAEPLLLLAIVAGTALRFHQISYQILADDEWHGLQTALYGSSRWVLSHFGENDYCIPLTIFYKLMMHTVGLSELVVRAPVLLSGLAALFVLPLVIRSWVGKQASLLFAWLLAIAPLHVYYSRYARPYSITLLLCCVGAVSFYKWWQKNERKWVVTYAGCAIAATYAHLIVAPFVLAPLAWAFAEVILDRPREAWALSLRRLVTLGAVVALGLSILLIPPLWSDWQSIGSKLQGQGVIWSTVVNAIELFVGTKHWWLIAALVGAMLVGLAVTARTQARLVGYLAFLTTVQTIPSLLGRASYIEVPIVFARYNLPLLPVALIFVAVGLTYLDSVLQRLWVGLRGIAGTVACVLLFFCGPLPQIYYRPNNWTNHAIFQYAYDEDTQWSYAFLKPRQVSPFYQELGKLPKESVRIVEAPWYYEWQKNPYPYYQRVHGQYMFVGMVDDRPTPRAGEVPLLPRLRFHNFIHVADHIGLLTADIRFIVFHKNFALEARGARFDDLVDIARWVNHYRRRYATPYYEDQYLVVFDLTKRRPG